ncbi:MAG: HipA domain-containing protein [Clostridia bacterium]
MDYSKYKPTDTYYSGSEKKIGIVIDGSEYMLKFQKKTAFGLRFNHISEYLGSHIFELLGFDAQKTFLGTYKGEQVVACKNFVSDNTGFVPFNDVGESTLDQDKETYQYDYIDIMQMLHDNSKLTDVNETISMFWNMYIVDALIGNFDRHRANWGFLKQNNKYRLAPIFDNGSCLFPQLTDEEEMKNIIASETETNKRVFQFPTSQIMLNGKKSSYFDVISSLSFKECNEALTTVVNKIDMSKINSLIDNTEFVTETHKAFYKHMLNARYSKILSSSFDTLTSR